ncbi:hypothetical protein PVK06_009288 [Gossypium arboreum]|uniref:RNase H type-1 domain-containing protein n=1 Tax=Gossypium arboreum TaxID=29729 RepID=A0ABR0QMD8_GOSAR|nr:hypothetical protein PVK06_009288 [Gossypium arboreum]
MQSAEEIVTFIMRSFGLEYWGCALNLKHPKPRSMIKWMPPPQEWVKINVDAGISVNKNHAVSGFIIRNDEGLIMGSGFKGHHLTRSVVEALAFLHGLQFALEMGFTKVIIESDSRIQFIAREGNRAAHAMAVEGLQNEADFLWVEDAPLRVVEEADANRRYSQPL